MFAVTLCLISFYLKSIIDSLMEKDYEDIF
jgi:hypothetical protein